MPNHPAAALPEIRRPFRGFDIEQAAYSRIKADLLARHEGRYVVFVGEEWVGPFPTHAEAESAGYRRFGLGPLLIKRVVAEDPVVEVTRLVLP